MFFIIVIRHHEKYFTSKIDIEIRVCNVNFNNNDVKLHFLSTNFVLKKIKIDK